MSSIVIFLFIFFLKNTKYVDWNPIIVHPRIESTFLNFSIKKLTKEQFVET